MKHRDDDAFIERLAAESAAWEREGLLGPDQRERLLASSRARSRDGGAPPARLVVVIGIMGAILAGAGVLLFMAANWSAITNPVRLSLVVGAMLAAYGIGFRFRFGEVPRPATGHALILLGTIIYGAGIFLVAQIYHVTAHYPNGFLLWGVGVIPLAVLVRSRPLLSLVIVNFLVWLELEARLRVADASAGELATLTLVGMAGIALWVVGLGLRGTVRGRELASPPLVIGILVTFGSAFLLTFDLYGNRLGSETLFPFYVAIAVLFIGCVGFRVRYTTREQYWEGELIALFLLLAGAVFLTIASRGGGIPSSPLVLVVNLLFAVGTVGIIVLGYLRHWRVYVNLGLAFFVADLIARYCDIFWRLLPRSLFFICGGGALLGAGLALEKKRRALLAESEKEQRP